VSQPGPLDKVGLVGLFIFTIYLPHALRNGILGVDFLPLLYIGGVCWILGFHPHSHLSAFHTLASGASLSLSRLCSYLHCAC
jgi:hypothetical protein